MLRLIVFIVVSLLALPCFATDGCVANGMLYPSKIGTYNGYDAYSTSGAVTTNPLSCPRATITGAVGATCVVLTSIWSPVIGTERHYSLIVACPIDDDAPLMLAIAGGFGAYVLRRKFPVPF